MLNLSRIAKSEIKSIESYAYKTTDKFISLNEEKFAENGIFIKEGLFKNEVKELDQLKSKVLNIVESHCDDEYYETEEYRYQQGLRELRKYSHLANYKKPIIMKRSGADEGMIDIFNIDRLIQNKNIINQIIKTLKTFECVSDYNLQSVNMYINKGITSTRCFHLDTNNEKLKGFIYLTPVETLDDGPYSYIIGSHRSLDLLSLNNKIFGRNKHKFDVPVVPTDQAVACTGSAGTLVVSDQKGVHRGHPQSSDFNSRILLAFNLVK